MAVHVLWLSPWLGLGLGSALHFSHYKWGFSIGTAPISFRQHSSNGTHSVAEHQLLHGVAISSGGKTPTQCKRDLRKPSLCSCPRPGRSNRTWGIFKHLPTEAHCIRPGHGSTPPKEPCSMDAKRSQLFTVRSRDWHPGLRGSRGAPESPESMSILTNLEVQAVHRLFGLCVCVLDDLVWACQTSSRCKGWAQYGLGHLDGVMS